jgi:uncharacterized damage-inducible protein DinB
MLRDALEMFARHHAWADDRILTLAAEVPDGDLRAPARLDHGSAWDTLRHLVDVNWSWREFCVGNDIGDGYVWDYVEGLDDLAGLHALAREDDATLRTYIVGLDDPALAEELFMTPEEHRPRWLILLHLLNHGTQHRTELARFLTDHGHSPGDLDLLDVTELP